jgi:hypothetical protein
MNHYRKNRYPQGYQPKIAYWNSKLVQAIEAMDPKGVSYASEKLAYFVMRQNEVYGRIAQLYND